MRNKKIIIVVIGLVGALLFGELVESLVAFTSIKKRTIQATVTIGATGESGNLKVDHRDLNGISSITKDAIIQGEAGTNLTGRNSPFGQRITSQSTLIKAEGDPEIRVRLQYRFVPPNVIDPSVIPLKEAPPIDGPNPLSFAFKVDPTDIELGSLQYKLIVERLEEIAGSLKVVETITYPRQALTNPDFLVSVGIVASAANAFPVRQGGRIFIANGNPNVGQTMLELPANLFNSLSVITLNEISLTDPQVPPLVGIPTPVAIYRLDSDRFDGFLKGTFLYPDFKFPLGQQGLLGDTGHPETMATLVWWDGFEWRRLASAQDTSLNTLTAKLAYFQFLAIVPLGASSAKDLAPAEKVITPNGDGINDFANFSVVSLDANVSIDIYDVGGHRMRTLRSPNNLRWDGRDDSGSVVESGIYIYQYSAAGERVSGVIVVAK